MMEINSFCNKYNICVICLSTDRKLRPAVDTKIITNISKIKFSDTCNVCWECNANVRSIVSFRNKVLKAQSIIKSLFKTRMGETLIPSLSQLQQRNIENVGIKPLDAAVPDFISTFHQSNLTLPGIEERTESCIAEEVSSHGVEINGIDIPDDDEIYVVYVDNEGENNNSNENEHRNIYRVRIMGEEEMINDRESRRKSSRFIKCTLKCEECVEIYSNKKCLNHHMKKHEKTAGKFVCPICTQRFLVQSELEEHYTTHYRSYRCVVCELEFHSEELVVRHHRDDHSQHGHTCHVCQRRFQTKKLYQLHRRNSHKARKKCPICKKVLGPNADLKKHMLIHTSVVFECNICNKKYRSESGIRFHRRTAHREQKEEDAYCAECDVQFKAEYIYRMHLRTSLKHNTDEDLKHKCPHCDKRCKFASLLKHHIESVHTKEMIYSCQLCDQAFSTSRRLRVHVRLKHEGKCRPKNKICTICSKAFETKSGLQQHMNAHTGARPFSCSECAATFAQSGALYTHRKLLHDRHKRRKPVQTRTDQ